MPLIPEAPNPVLPPNTPAGQTPATPAVPNVPSGQAAVNPAAPNAPSGQAAVNPAIPNTPTGIAAVDPAAPNASSAETAVNPSAPNLLGNTAENLMVFSENLNGAGWTRFEAIVFNDQNFAPDGTLSADLLRDTVVNSIHRATQLVQASIIAGQIYTFSVYVKAQNGNRGIALREDTSDGLDLFVNPNNGSINASNGLLQSSSANVGNGWYRVSMTGVVSVANPAFELRLTQTPTSTATSYAGNAVDGVILWGAQVNAGSLGPYIPTLATFKTGTLVSIPNTPSSETPVDPVAPRTLAALAPSGEIRSVQPLFNFNASLGLPSTVVYTRASSASYLEVFRNARGSYDERLVNDFVGSVENLVLYSQDFDNAAWSNQAGATINANVEIAPNGTKTAARVNGNGGVFSRVQQSISESGQINLSLYVKKDIGNTVVIRMQGTGINGGTALGVEYNFITGQFIRREGNTGSEYSASYQQNGWYRISIEANTTTLTDVRLATELDSQADGSVFIWGLQVTQSLKAIPYVRTLNIAVTQTFTANPRYEEKGLLVESASTNINPQSESFGGFTQNTITLVEKAGLAPDGSYSSNLLTFTSVGGSLIGSAAFTDAGQQVTLSFYIKNVDCNEIQLRPAVTGGTTLDVFGTYNFNSKTWVAGTLADTGTAEYIGDDWIRLSVTITANNTGNNNVQVRLTGTANNVIGQRLYCWGAQVEVLPIATSYIRTAGSTASRSRDEVNANIMTLGRELSILSEHSYIGGSDVNNGNRNVYVLSDGTVNNRYGLRNINNANGFLSAANGVAEIFFSDSTVLANGISANIAVTITPDNVLMYNNGILSATEDPADINPLPQGINAITFNTNTVGGGLHLNGHIKRIQVYDVELTASEVQVL
jgi:hypothetical protein